MFSDLQDGEVRQQALPTEDEYDCVPEVNPEWLKQQADQQAQQVAQVLDMQQQEIVRFKRECRLQALSLAVQQYSRCSGVTEQSALTKYADDIYNWLTADL